MVNFFEHQQQARRNTSLLVVLFLLAFILIVGGVGLVTVFIAGGISYTQQQEMIVHWQPLLIVMGIVGGAILLVMLVKWLTLKSGGHVVAESLGGRRLQPNSKDVLERRVLNVVEEMAIAANMPVPAVYLLPDEANINAFAAGYNSQDAVIGLTQGAVETFSRDQLQAVVAHEFSHILNGDMRLNIRLIAALAGIIAIAHFGRILLYSGGRSSGFGSRRKSNNALPLLGILLMIVGGIGVFFGHLIKAAVSRQREYLADAAAVQFTRNPTGLAGALKQIGARYKDYPTGGSRIRHRNADETSHLFFGEALKHWFGMMATHPPLADRIKRVDPYWNGVFPERKLAFSQSEQESAAAEPKPSALHVLAGLALPALLVEQARTPDSAVTLVHDLVLDCVLEQPNADIHQLNYAQQLALVELSIPALKQLSESKRLSIIKDMAPLQARQDPFHWGLYQLLARHLLPAKRFKAKLDNDQALAATEQALDLAEQRQAIDLDQLEKALTTCRDWSPKMKQVAVKKWLAAVQQDGKVSNTEQKLVAVYCACIETPLPDAMLKVDAAT